MVEQIPLSCHSCKQVFHEILEEARKYSKSNPFICNLCYKKSQNPEQKLLDDELLGSRSDDSRVSNDPAVIEAQQSRSNTPPPIVSNHNSIHIHIGHKTQLDDMTEKSLPPPNTLQYYESIAKGEIKEKLDEFKARREKTERDLAEDRRRVAQNYEYGGGRGSMVGAIFGIVFMIVFIGILSAIVFPIFTSSIPSSINSIDCTFLSGNAGPHQTLSNATGVAHDCLTAKSQASIVTYIIPFLIAITIIVIVLRVIVMILL